MRCNSPLSEHHSIIASLLWEGRILIASISEHHCCTFLWFQKIVNRSPDYQILGGNDALKCDNRKIANRWYQRDCGDIDSLQNCVSRARVFLPLPGKHLISHEIGRFSLLFGAKCFIKQENDALLQQRESIVICGFYMVQQRYIIMISGLHS